MVWVKEREDEKSERERGGEGEMVIMMARNVAEAYTENRMKRMSEREGGGIQRGKKRGGEKKSESRGGGGGKGRRK